MGKSHGSTQRRLGNVGFFSVVTALVVAALSVRIVGFDWVMFDDDINVLMNPFLGRGAVSSLGWAFGQFDYIRRYVPLGWLWFDGVVGVGGYNAAVFHAASVVLHAANAGLAVVLFRKILLGSSGQSATPAADIRTDIAAALVALLWSVHPLRAENVGWISGQFYLLATTLALVGAWCFVRHAGEAEDPADGKDRTPIEVIGAVFFGASLLVYPVFLGLPAVLTGWRIVFRPPRRRVTGAIRSLLLWWALAIVDAVLNGYAAATATGAFAWTSARLGWKDGFISTLATYAHYAGSTVLPTDVTVFYGPVTSLFSTPTAVIGGLGAVIALAAAVWSRRTRRGGWLVAVGFVVSLAPFVAQVDTAFTPSDRYAVVWLTIACIGLAAWLKTLATGFHVGLILLALATTALAVDYCRALGQWRDTFTLQAAIDARNSRVRNSKMCFARPAMEWWWLGQRAESARRLAEGLALFPDDASLRETKTLLIQLDQRYRARVGDHSSVMPLALQHLDLGKAWLARGEPAAAAAHFRAALQRAPGYPDAAAGLRRSGR